MNQLRITPSTPGQLETVLGILDEARNWLVSNGITNQWTPGTFSASRISQQIQLAEVYLAELDHEVVGIVTLQWVDELFWPKAPPDAGYLHKLALKQQYHGRELGLQIIEWAAGVASTAGKKYLRLNCIAENKRLRDYYEQAGFVYKGDVERSKWSFSLYEKKNRAQT